MVLHYVTLEQPRRLHLMTLRGAHRYGLPFADSDYNLRGAHILPLRGVVGLDGRHEAVERSMVLTGDDVDVVKTSASERPPTRAIRTSTSASRRPGCCRADYCGAAGGGGLNIRIVVGWPNSSGCR